MIHFHAGWALPGCLPETPYEAFATRDEAHAYLADEERRHEDDGTPDDYVYELFPCDDVACMADNDVEGI